MSKQRENNRDDHIDPPRTIPLFERIFKVDRDKIYRKHLLAMFKQGQGTNNLSIVSCESGAETMPAQTAFDKVLSNYCSPVKYHRSQELPNDFPERGAAVKRSGSNSVRRSKRGGGMEREKKIHGDHGSKNLIGFARLFETDGNRVLFSSSRSSSFYFTYLRPSLFRA